MSFNIKNYNSRDITMKILLTGLLFLTASSVYAGCNVNSMGYLVDNYGNQCTQQRAGYYGGYSNEDTYKRTGNSLQGNSINNYRESYNSNDNGNTWNPTSPDSRSRTQGRTGLEIDTGVHTPNPYVNQSNSNNSRIGLNYYNP